MRASRQSGWLDRRFAADRSSRLDLMKSGPGIREEIADVEILMIDHLELEGLYELWAALLEERRMIVASVKSLRDTHRRKGSFVVGDGAASGPGFMALQQQIDCVESVIARLTKDATGEFPPTLRAADERNFG
ncbi:hypothetical protein [Methylobacterium sp. 391_Methyba4]|uniref:hypothetical protein n=1 Tax=Methylobacterium sp. 391_Methyba4 TaxID=3038924 RepID=UPI00241F72B2|nr:hypothetical protein [Methylobacterium sp. 391_Methyba4]WFS09088.1 hypothetical protein P9K36_07280 [Methylobacterium sp. 391_Methyba4]